jgi:hypothetical protein
MGCERQSVTKENIQTQYPVTVSIIDDDGFDKKPSSLYTTNFPGSVGLAVRALTELGFVALQAPSFTDPQIHRSYHVTSSRVHVVLRIRPIVEVFLLPVVGVTVAILVRRGSRNTIPPFQAFGPKVNPLQGSSYISGVVPVIYLSVVALDAFSQNHRTSCSC